MQETWVQSLGWEDPLEKEVATHSSIIAWKILWTEEPGELQSMGSQTVGHDWVTNTYLLTYLLTALPTSQPKLCLTIKSKEVNSKGKIGCLWRCRPREGFTEEMTLKLSMYKLREKTAHVEKIYLIWLHR